MILQLVMREREKGGIYQTDRSKLFSRENQIARNPRNHR